MEDILHALGFVLIAGSAFLGLILIERWYWIRKHRPEAYQTREVFANIATGFMYKMFDGVVVAVFVTHFYDHIRAFGLQYTPENKWAMIALLFVVTDLIFYGLHVAMHKLRYAWCSHVTHHSSTRFNLSTALRQNFLFDLSGLAILWWLPLALIGFDKLSVVVAIELNLFYQFFIHTEVVKRMPAWYEAIFNTPSHHRVHHGRNPAQIDTNFGGVLIIWDRLFGSFVDERDAGRIEYGITNRQPTTLNPLRLNLDEWFAMWRDVWTCRDLRILWKHPDWVEQRYPDRRGVAMTTA
ncbi:sterol desaturase family protein [Sinimarinibacterium sp. CAU 1509]|uniref:sterol desaturase family protein n=1 Tax=Sinimarinibacterium sp. CAU 1509 TaxID=2562283 RepID=UPI0010ACBA3F|nr:sterol desaturase family protein [Sinimarinibacterium sp. CAU 1509]TJY60996.1 sterol desaturase family protein [Sinimarinibacterium sp. CAU 1509]